MKDIDITLRGLREVRDQILSDNKSFRKVWNDTEERRRLSQLLLRARNNAGLTQQMIADRTGWDKSFVSRTESLNGPSPGLSTISRYLGACGASLGLIVGVPADANHVRVLDAMSIGDDLVRAFDYLDLDEVPLQKGHSLRLVDSD